jgi:hypothetical protein
MSVCKKAVTALLDAEPSLYSNNLKFRDVISIFLTNLLLLASRDCDGFIDINLDEDMARLLALWRLMTQSGLSEPTTLLWVNYVDPTKSSPLFCIAVRLNICMGLFFTLHWADVDSDVGLRRFFSYVRQDITPFDIPPIALEMLLAEYAWLHGDVAVRILCCSSSTPSLPPPSSPPAIKRRKVESILYCNEVLST